MVLGDAGHLKMVVETAQEFPAEHNKESTFLNWILQDEKFIDHGFKYNLQITLLDRTPHRPQVG